MRAVFILSILFMFSCSDPGTPVPNQDQFEREDVYDPNQYKERRL